MRELRVQLGHMFRIIRHPLDGIDELRRYEKGSYLSATVILLLVILCRVVTLKYTNFIFNKNGLDYLKVSNLFLQVILPFFLWVVANYLVSTITKGQGRFVDVYVGTAYALTPYVLFSIPVAIISNIFTLQEAAIYNFLYMLVMCSTGLIIYLSVIVVHGYEIFEAVGNIIWTVFAMAMILIVFIAISGMFFQNLDYLYSIFLEVLDIV